MRERKPAAKPEPSKMTKRQLSRHEREVRLQRIAVLGVGLALLVALLVPLYGYWREVLTKGDQPIAVVHGESISTQAYARYLGFEQAMLQRDITRATDRVAKAQPNSPEQQTAQIELQILQQGSQSLSSQAFSDLIEGKLVRDEAAKRGLTASPAELDAALQKEMTQGIMTGYTGSSTAGAPAETLSLDQSKQDLAGVLGKGSFFSEDEVRTLVLEPQVLKAKLTDQLSASQKTSGEQVRARHILVETEDQAKAVLDRLNKGEDFAALAKELSTDTSNKDKGGELDWFPRGVMDPDFEKAVFAMKPGEISQPIKTSYGYHIVQLEERADDRPYSADYVQQQRDKAFGDWFSAQQSSDGLQILATQDKVTWASNYVAKQLAGAKG